MTVFTHRETIRPDWIDYNGHMQDAYYGLIFSYAVDAFQDAVGFDAAYRKATGCTIYLVEDHKFFLREVKQGMDVTVETRLLEFDGKRFHLHQTMYETGDIVAIGEVMELHVNQHPKPHAAEIPAQIAARLGDALVGADDIPLPHKRARALTLGRG